MRPSIEDPDLRALYAEQGAALQQQMPRGHERWVWLFVPILLALLWHGMVVGMALFFAGLCGRAVAFLPGTPRVRLNAAFLRNGCWVGMALCLALGR